MSAGPTAQTALLDWREVGRIEIDRFDFHVDRSVLLRVGPHLLADGISAERRPVLLGGFPALVREDVDERVLGQGWVNGRPEADDRKVVLLEQRKDVIP